MIDKDIRRGLLTIARTFAKAKGWKLSTVGRKIHGKASFFEDLAKGRCSLTVDSLGRMIQAFSDGWPDGTAWPELAPVEMSMPPKKPVKKVAR